MPNIENYRIATARGKGSLTPGSENYGDKAAHERKTKYYIKENVKKLNPDTGIIEETAIERQIDPSRVVIVDGKETRPDLELLKRIKQNPGEYQDRIRVLKETKVENIYSNEDRITSDSVLRKSTYEKPSADDSNKGRTVTRFKDKVEVNYNIVNPKPDDIVKEIYHRDKKETFYANGKIETKLKNTTPEKSINSNDNEITNVSNTSQLIEAFKNTETLSEKEIKIISIDDIQDLSFSEIVSQVKLISSLISKTEHKNSEIEKLKIRIEELQKSKEELEKKQEEEQLQAKLKQNKSILSRILKPKRDSVNHYDNQNLESLRKLEEEINNLNSQIMQIESEIKPENPDYSLEKLTQLRNKLVESAIVDHTFTPLIERGTKFSLSQDFTKVSKEYSLYKKEIKDLIDSIYNNEEIVHLIESTNNSDSILMLINKEIIRNSSFGLNALLLLAPKTENDKSILSEKLVKTKIETLIRDCISSPKYGPLSDFISSPRFLKIFTLIKNKERLNTTTPDNDFGTPDRITQIIYSTLDAIARNTSNLNPQDIQNLIDIIPDDLNPDSQPKNDNYLLFYLDLYNLISSSDKNFRKFQYVNREVEETRVMLSETLQHTPNPQPDFLSKSLKVVNEELSRTSIFNTNRILLEINESIDTDYSANFTNDNVIRDYYSSKRVSNQDKENFFLTFRNIISSNKPTYNSINAFLSILESEYNTESEYYRNNYVIPQVNENLREYLKSDLAQNKEISVLGNPYLFSYLNNDQNFNLHSTVFNSRELASREDLYEIRRLYSLILYPEKSADNLHNSEELKNTISIMQGLFPRGIIFKNIIQDSGKLRELYLSVSSEYPFVYKYSVDAKEIIENLSPTNRNITVDEFKEILHRANEELKKIKESN